MNISEMLIRPKGKTLEFKRDISSLKPILKILVAFANTAGGILIIGRESDGTVHGVTEVLQREMGLMEEWGSGYKRVIHACQFGGYPEPDWEELGTAFRVIFYPHPAVLEHSRTSVPASIPANDRQRWFLEQLAADKRTRASDLAVYWSISEKIAKRDIADLKRKGLIEFVGAPKNGFFRLCSFRTQELS